RAALGISEDAKRFDTVLMGRSTYEVGLREGIASPYAHLRQYVVSTTMPHSPAQDLNLCRKNPLELVRSLKREHGMDIWICGGSRLASALAPEIDELILKINPVVFGSGIPLFDGLHTAMPTILRDQKRYPNGFVLAHYDLVRS